jgi:hypothetical protein
MRDERASDAAALFVVDDLDGQLGRVGPLGRSDPPDDPHRAPAVPRGIRLVLSRPEIGEHADHAIAEPRHRSGVAQPARRRGHALVDGDERRRVTRTERGD